METVTISILTLRIESPFLGTKEIGMTSIKFTLIASHTTLDMMVNFGETAMSDL